VNKFPVLQQADSTTDINENQHPLQYDLTEAESMPQQKMAESKENYWLVRSVDHLVSQGDILYLTRIKLIL